MIRTFLRDSVIYTIPTIVSRGLFLFLVPVYTRVLSPVDFGVMDMLIVFGSLANLTVALEVSQGVARFYPDEKDQNAKIAYASTAFWFTLCCYTAFFVGCFVFSGDLARLVVGRDGFEGTFLIGVAYIWFNGLFYLLQNQFRWELRSKEYAFVSLLVSLITATASILLAYVLWWGLAGILAGMLLGSACGCLYGLWKLQSSIRRRFDTAKLREMLMFSAPLVPSGVAVFVGMYIDRYMINYYLSLNEVGLYGVAYRLAGACQLIMVGFQSALTPLVYTYYRDPETPKHIARIFRIFLFAAFFGFMALSLFAYEILWLLATPSYYAAGALVIFLAPAVMLSQMYVFAPGIGIAKKTHLIIWINILGAILHIGLNLYFIPHWGLAGAAMAKLIGYGCMFGAYIVISQKLYPVPHNWVPIGAAAAVLALMSVAGTNLELTPVIGISAKIMMLALIPVVFLWFGLITKQEIRNAMAIVNGRLRRSGGGGPSL